MKKFSLFLVCLLITSLTYAQALPIDFESGITTANFVDFSGGVATVLPNPQSSGDNTSATVAQIVRDGGEIWAGSKISLANNLDFTTDNVITMKVFMTAPVGTQVKFKLESVGGAVERDAYTTVSGAWETLTWDFTGTANVFNDLVFMFDFGNLGDGSATSTFLFDDIQQIFGGFQIDLPVTFENSTINYTMTDFEGNTSFPAIDPVAPNNNVRKIVKTVTAGSSAGTTIGTPAGFATDIPLTLTDSKMSVRVWSPDAGTPIRLKVEDSSDPTHTCETETNTTVAGGWEYLVFDFANEAPGTAALSFGLNNGWTYNMASIFMDFGTPGSAADKTYYFDNVYFGIYTSTKSQYEVEGLDAFPNPATNQWTITSEKTDINRIELFDLQGKLLISIQPNNNEAVINASNFSNGVYISKIYTDLGMKTLKLVK